MKQKKTCIKLLAIMALVGIVSLASCRTKEKQTDDAPKIEYVYTFSEITNIRSTTVVGSDANIMEKAPYGTELELLGVDAEWTHIKSKGQEGYAASYYVVGTDDYLLMNSMFADIDARYNIDNARCKRALLNYYKYNKLFGIAQGPTPEIYKDYDAGWAVYAKKLGSRTNAVHYAKLMDPTSQYPDFAVIISKPIVNESKVLVFSFDDNTEEATLVYQASAPINKYIYSISNKRGKIDVDYR